MIATGERDTMAAVAVGDVVGHGLAAAGVMGQLRSALSAAARVTSGPGAALEALGLYVHSVRGAESTTVVASSIDWATHRITYSSAGHPPPALRAATAPSRSWTGPPIRPLGVRLEHTPRLEASTAFDDDAVLVLYTDGLIERRGEDIDAGLTRLARSLTRHRRAAPDTLADALLADLLPPGGATDDTALVIVRL